jgi:hypothetical protein
MGKSFWVIAIAKRIKFSELGAYLEGLMRFFWFFGILRLGHWPFTAGSRFLNCSHWEFLQGI